MIKSAGDLAKDLDLEYPTAVGVLKFLVKKGLAKESGKRPTVTGKGKPSILYDVPEQVTISLTTS